MSTVPQFIEVLEIAQRKEKFTPEVQELAEGIDAAVLASAVQVTLAAKDTEAIDNAAFTDALKAGFEFAVKAVLMLQSAPGNNEKTNLYVYFKIANGQKLEKPGMFDLVVRYLSSQAVCFQKKKRRRKRKVS